jgi:hypothetical protein
MEWEMAERIRKLIAKYLSGETTYPDALSSLGTLVGYKQAHDVLRCAVETDGDAYLAMVPAGAQ